VTSRGGRGFRGRFRRGVRVQVGQLVGDLLGTDADPLDQGQCTVCQSVSLVWGENQRVMQQWMA
jgi:hypothetical protein